MLRTNTVRSDLRASSIARSAEAIVWTNTKDASPTAMVVPVPMLTFSMKGAGAMSFAGSIPVQHPGRRSFEDQPLAPLSSRSGRAIPAVEELPDESVATATDATELTEPPKEETSELQTPVQTELADNEPVAALEPEPQPSVETHQIELIINSLPRHELTEPIPVTVASLGDQVFTASVHALDVVGTGNTLGDALIIVKEQIEILYEKLSKAVGLDKDEKKYLAYLQSHIKSSGPESSRHSKRSIWR